jgi:hypothetical protein
MTVLKTYWKRHKKARAPGKENPSNYWIYIEKAIVYYDRIGGEVSKSLL